MHFYYRCIEPKIAAIDEGRFAKNPASALNLQDFSKLMGFSFERWCRRNAVLIAERIGFAGVVDYVHGAWFEKSIGKSEGARIDLMYIRKDSKIIFCEIKYNNGPPLTRKIFSETQAKLETFIERNPKYRRYTLETALITAESAPKSIKDEGYFAYLIDAGELFEESFGREFVRRKGKVSKGVDLEL